jgi:hypothetical protein
MTCLLWRKSECASGFERKVEVDHCGGRLAEGSELLSTRKRVAKCPRPPRWSMVNGRMAMFWL